MLRLLQFLVLSTLAAILVSWLAKQTGVTIISWAGWQIEMRTSLLVAGLVIAVVLLLLIYRLLRMLFLWPGWLGHNWQARRRKKGERALSLGMVAFAAGDHKMARRQARKAEKLLGPGLLPDLLSAQAAHAAGDGKAAMRYFTALSKNEDTSYFGHLGLMRLYQEQGKDAQSIEAAQKALAHADGLTPAAIRVLAEEIKSRQWRAALDRLSAFLRKDKEALSSFGAQDGLASGQLNDPSLLAAHLSVLVSEEAAEGDKKACLERALDHSPRMIEASRRLALLATDSQKKSAVKRLEKDFKAFPHSQLADMLARLSGDNEGQFIARLGKLAQASAYPDAGHLIAAEWALKSGIWASASSSLAEISPPGQTNKYFLLVADLAEKKHKFATGGDASMTSADTQNQYTGSAADSSREKEEALKAAAHAPHAASWHCRACYKGLIEWEMICPACSVLGQVDWCQAGISPPLAIERKDAG